MLIDFTALTAAQAYFAMIQTIIPRPIAWVLSDNGDGSYNLAPFSFFNGVSGEPPLIMISVGRKPDGSRKDTWVNIEARSDFVVHIPPADMAQEMVATAATLPHGESELTKLGLATAAEPGFRLPRLVGPRAAMFCVKHKIVEVGDGPQGLILGEIKALYIDDAAGQWRDNRLIIDPKQLDPVARLGGEGYALLGELMKIALPR